MGAKIIQFKMGECDRNGFVSVADVAAKTSLSPATIYKAIESGSLIAYQLMGKYCLRPADVERWVLIKAIKVKGVTKNERTQRNRARISA